jgi:hypothetical protein
MIAIRVFEYWRIQLSSAVAAKVTSEVVVMWTVEATARLRDEFGWHGPCVGGKASRSGVSVLSSV